MAGKTANRETLTPHVLHMTVLLLSLVTFSGVIVIHVNWSKAEMVMGNVSTLMSAEALDTDLNPPLSNGPLETTGNFFTAAPSPTAAPTSLVPRVSATAAAVPVESTPQPTTVVPARWTTVEAPPADTRVTTLESTTLFATLTSAPETEPAATAAPLNETATSSSKRAVPASHGDAVVNTRARPPLPPTATEEAQFIFLEPTKDPVKIEPPAPLKGHRIWVEVEPAPSTLDLEDGDAVSAHVSEQVGRIVADMSHDIFTGRDPFSNTTTGPRPAVDLQSPYFNAPGLGNIIVNQGLGNLADAPKHVYPAGNEILDAVITHVDHNAPGWADLMRKFLRPGQPADLARFRDLGELQYCISGILHHGGSFIRNVHVIVASESHVPAWLARLRETERSLHERIRIVTHDQIFPKDCSDGSQTCYLPTFSSCAIEATMHRIPGLSPYFIYFNNDMFFGRRLSLYDYFRPVLAATPVDMNKVSQDNDFPMPLKANALHKAFVAAKSTNQRAMAWLQGRFAVGERTSAFGVNMVTGQGLGLTGEDAPRRFFVEFEPLVFSERKDLPNGCSPYKEDQGVKDGALVCREKNPNFARQHALKNAKLRHARCPHITNSSRDPEIPNFKKNDGPRSSRSLLMPGPCYFATAEEYELASALYVTLWKKLKSAESQSNTSTRTDAEVDDIIREARAEARTIRGLKPMPGGHMGHSVRTGRFLGLKAPVKDDQYDFNIFYTVNKRRGWDYFGVFPTHTFAHAPRVMDQGGLVDMLNLLHPLTVSTRSHRFRESIDLFVPYLWELYAVADRRHRRERMQASRAMLLPGDAESIMPTTAPASLRVDICHRNVSLQRRVVFSPAVMPIDYRQWRVNCADTENDLVAQLRPLGPILPTNLLQASINMPSRPPNAFGVTWTQGSTNYATEKLISEFFVMNLKPMYYFAMVANRFEVKKYKAELARQVTAFITVNDNFRNVDALTLTTIQEMFRVVIGDAPLLGLD